MLQLDPGYLAELARQFGFLSAFLGGVAATFLAQLLALRTTRKVVAWCIVLAAGAAVAFIVSVLGATLLIAAVHPGAPPQFDAAGTDLALVRLLAFLPFLLGLVSLLATVGASGWIRSRKTGWATTSMAVMGGLLGGWTLVGL